MLLLYQIIRRFSTWHCKALWKPVSIQRTWQFREPHQDGGMHFHIATAFSEPFRWIGWKKALQSRSKVVHFSNMAIDHHSRYRQMQYAYMLRYLWLPSKKKPLTALDKEPLLWCRHGKSHPPLLDAINGALSCEAIQEKVAEVFLQRYAAGKRTTAKFTDVELWPIVRELQVLPDELLLLEKLLKRARDTGNERLLAYIFRNAADLREKVQICISESELTGKIKAALLSGLRRKQDAVCFAGSGNEGKSWLLRPLTCIQRVSWRIF